MFNNKVSVGTSLGVQRNNLDNSLAKGVRKVAYAGNLGWMATEKLNFAASYSNFNTQTLSRRTPNLQPVDIQLDTLEFFQVTQSSSFNTMYRFGSTNKQQNLMLAANMQNANDSEGNDNNSFNGNLTYGITFVPISLNINASYNYNKTLSNLSDIEAHGPTISGSMPAVNKKISLTLAITSLRSLSDGELQSTISNINFGARYSLKKKHNFSLTALRSSRKLQTAETDVITENRINIQYAYSF